MTNKPKFTQFYLNHAKTRWCFLGEDGEKSKIHFKTLSGKTITRTAQYFDSSSGEVKVMISYKGAKREVKLKTVLED